MFEILTKSGAQGVLEPQRFNTKKWPVLACRLVLLVGCTLTAGLNAQTGQGAITGRVTDSSGAVIPKASVQIVNNDTRVALTTVTNDAGLYDIQSLNPGQYTVTVSGPGFESQKITTVTVSAAQTTTADVTMQPGRSNQTVTVTAQAPLLNTNSDVSTTIDHQIVQNLPYPEVGALEASLLAPGVTTTYPATYGGISPEDPQTTTAAITPGSSITVGGAPPGTASIKLDGSEIVMASYPRAGINMSGPLVSEMTVLTTGVPAPYGDTSGGVIVETSRAGTAQFHGIVAWRHNDPFFNAWPLGSTAPSDQHENFFAGDAGGPVIIPRIYTGHGKNKTFFFGGYEPARARSAGGYRGAFNTDADVAGQLHNTLNLLNKSILDSQGYAAAVAAPRIGGIYTNSTVNAQGFPNGKIGSAPPHQETGPSGLDDVSAELADNPFAQYAMSLMPTPSHPGPYVEFDNPAGTYDESGNNADYLRGVTDEDNRYSIRIDHQFNNSNQIFFRYTVEPITGPRFYALAISNPANQVQTDDDLSRDFATGYTLVLSSTVVNNFHYSLMRSIQDRTPPQSALTEDFGAKYGLTPATVGKGFPDLGGFGFAVNGGNDSYYNDIDQNFDMGDVLAWSKGRHYFQFGGDIRWIQSNQYDTSFEYGGDYSFNANMTNTTGTSSGSGGSELATIDLADIYSYKAAPVEVPGYYRWRYYALFGQDNWRIMPKLTLNIGLRWEVETPRKEKFNNQAIMVPSTMTNPDTAAFCFSGSCGLGRGLWPTNWKGIEPRIGFSYAPTPKTTVSAAYGIFRAPITGYENEPDPDFNVASTTVGDQTGGTIPGSIVNYITNPVPKLVSSYTALGGSRGPFYSSNGFNPDYVAQTDAMPYLQSWDLSIEYEPTPQTLIKATYQGSKGTHLIGDFTGAINVPSLATLEANVAAGVNLSGTAIVPAGDAGVAGENVLQALNPYPGFANESIPQIYPRVGVSSYNSFSANVVHRYGEGLSMMAYYTWSKSMDDVPNVTAGDAGNVLVDAPQNPQSNAGEWSVSAYDVPSILKGGYNYLLPFGTGQHFQTHNRILDEVIGNFSTSGIMTWQSGFPSAAQMNVVGYFTSFTRKGSNPTPIGIAPGVSSPVCNPSGSTTYCAGSALPTGYVLRPNIVPGQPLINSHWKQNPFGLGGQALTPYLNLAAFAPPGALGAPLLGDASRTLPGARGPRTLYFDMDAEKGISIKERYKLNLTVSALDVFNHPMYIGSSTTSLVSSQTNEVSGAAAPSIVYNLDSSSFSHVQGGRSRVVLVGADFTF